MTHPFHPWKGQELPLIHRGPAWGREMVVVLCEDGTVTRLPCSWTDAPDPDPYSIISECGSRFRVDDLLKLIEVVDQVLAGA